MKSTSGWSIEQLSGAAPRGTTSSPSTNERLRLGPERPPIPGGPRWSPPWGGGPGTAPVRRGRHFPADRRRVQKDVASLGLGLLQYPDSLVAITTCNPRASPVKLGSRGWVETGHPRLEGKKPSTTTFPTLECVHSFLPGKA